SLESAWLFKIANQVVLNRRRAASRRRRVETADNLERLEDVVPSRAAEADALIGLSAALERLPEQQRTAVLLREWQGLSYHEIASELGVSHAAVETLLFRARRSLAEQLTAPRQTRRRGPLRSLNLGSLLATLKSFFSGAAAFKAVVAVAVAGSSVLALHDVAHPRAAAHIRTAAPVQ